jgi:hypothetical protein
MGVLEDEQGERRGSTALGPRITPHTYTRALYIGTCDRGNSNNTTEKTLSPHSLLVLLCLNKYIYIEIEYGCAANCDRSDAINDKSRCRKWRSGTNSSTKRISNESILYNAMTVDIYTYKRINVVNIKCAVYMITHVSAVASEMF